MCDSGVIREITFRSLLGVKGLIVLWKTQQESVRKIAAFVKRGGMKHNKQVNQIIGKFIELENWEKNFILEFRYTQIYLHCSVNQPSLPTHQTKDVAYKFILSFKERKIIKFKPRRFFFTTNM